MTEHDPLATATCIGYASSYAGKPRWSEVSIYRTTDGRYCAVRIGRSTIPGETDRVTTHEPTSAREIVNALSIARRTNAGNVVGSRIPDYVHGAIADAALNDPVFETEIAAALDVEQYGDTRPRDGSAVVVLPRRSTARSLRFCGRVIGSAAAKPPNIGETTLYAVDDGTYAVTVLAFAPWSAPSRLAMTHIEYVGEAYVGLTIPETMDVLCRRGGYTSLTRGALAAAIRSDPGFAAALTHAAIKALPWPTPRPGHGIARSDRGGIARDSARVRR
jgi:hypothetical protein